MGLITRRYASSRPQFRASPVPDIMKKASGGAAFRPFLYASGLILVGTIAGARYFGLNTGEVAVWLGAVAVVFFIAFTVISGKRARRELEEKRAELEEQLKKSPQS